MMKKLTLLLGICLVVSSAQPQRVIDVAKKGEGKIAINLGSYRAWNDATSRTFMSVLKADLNRSGYFKVTASGGQISVAGTFKTENSMQADVQVYNVATRARLLGKTYKGAGNTASTLAHKVADEILYAVTGKKGMASGKIALVGNRTGSKELYVCDMDGNNLKQVTSDRSIVVGPCWAPDGKAVTYTSYKRGYPNVFMTGRSKPLSDLGGLNASGTISPDGRSMAVILSKNGNPELYIKNLRTGLLTRMTRTRNGNEASPCWSPDGNHIAYVSDTSGRPQIYIIARNGGRPIRLTSSGTENVSPDWGKNGLIAFCSRIGGRYRIAIANPTAKSMRVLETEWADYEDPSWAPDGRHIVCSRTTKHRSSIYLLDTLKDSPVALISGSGDWFSPACSP
ncbi:MAG: PD40 domain-containing protein [Pontiella sp.]|nr:PD40 domain-containing protein [Pontiella sp.]